MNEQDASFGHGIWLQMEGRPRRFCSSRRTRHELVVPTASERETFPTLFRIRVALRHGSAALLLAVGLTNAAAAGVVTRVEKQALANEANLVPELPLFLDRLMQAESG